jgi:hypothetical protein
LGEERGAQNILGIGYDGTEFGQAILMMVGPAVSSMDYYKARFAEGCHFLAPGVNT